MRRFQDPGRRFFLAEPFAGTRSVMNQYTAIRRQSPGSHKFTKAFHPAYRADIDGLRAVAVLSVVGYHAFPQVFSGGFIGVDIFFVISGYLITLIIVNGIEKHAFSYAGFYLRRIRRIFPSLLAMMISTLAIGWFVLLPEEYERLGRHVAAGAAFLSNFILWKEIGYFDASASSKPLLHLWSLAIEEQFYLLWPFLLVLVRSKRGFLATTLAVGALSFALNVYLSSHDVGAAFYWPASRFWELMGGGALAYAATYRPEILKPFRHGRSVLGAALIALGLLLINENRAFPGWWALLPVIGAMLLISAGPEGAVNRGLLARGAMVWFGLISYPLYLWHWPALSLAAIVADGKPGPAVRLALCALAVALAWASYRFIERPLRFGGHGNRKGLVLSLAMVATGAFGLLLDKGVIRPRLDDENVRLISGAMNDWDYPMALQRLEGAKNTDAGVWRAPGKSEGATLFWGDSHVEQYGPRIAALLSNPQTTANSVVFATLGGCPAIPNVHERRENVSCSGLQNRALELARDASVTTIVVGSCWTCYFLMQTEYPKKEASDREYVYASGDASEPFRGGRGAEMAIAELERLLTELGKSGKRVFLLLDNPISPEFKPKAILSSSRLSGRTTDRIDVSRDQTALRDRLKSMAARAGVEAIDPFRFLCDRQVSCLRAAADGKPIHKDADHMRPFFVRDFIPYLDKTIDAR